jgi:hypothetical protein
LHLYIAVTLTMVYWIGIGLDSSSSMFIHYQLENLMRLY